MRREALILTCCVAANTLMAGTWYVAGQDPAASDRNAGTEAHPFKTISHAMANVRPGDSVYVKAGTYREEVVWTEADSGNTCERMALAAYPGHRPAIKGSEVVPGPWTPANLALRRPDGTPMDQAEYTPDAWREEWGIDRASEPPKPDAPPLPPTGDAPFVGIYTSHLEDYAQMVFCDEVRLKQIGLQGSPERAEKGAGFRFRKQWDGHGPADMRPGTFHYAADTHTLYVWLPGSSDPAEHTIEMAKRGWGIRLQGTWTVSGFDVRHVRDNVREHVGLVVHGRGVVVENCRVTDNGFVGLMVQGTDGVIRNNEIAHNGLCGLSASVGTRMLVEGNVFHDNSWRGNVLCGHNGNKIVRWKDSAFIRNRFYDETRGIALWLDINVNNTLVAENTFENCMTGVYFEISRWGVIANNVFRRCDRAIWNYSSDTLIAHNVLDQCGEGIVVTGSPRHAWLTKSIAGEHKDCRMASRNNLVLNNVIIDTAAASIHVTEPCADSWGNYTDHNMFVWTLPMGHSSGDHIRFAKSWHEYYGKLTLWRRERQYDGHSVVSDPGLLAKKRAGRRYIYLRRQDLVGEPRFVDRSRADYRLRPDSPLKGRGITVPAVLNSVCPKMVAGAPEPAAWAPTQLTEQTEGVGTTVVERWERKHYRIQPLPLTRRLVDLDAQSPADPGLNSDWLRTGRYPRFATEGGIDTAAADDACVFPGNRLDDPGFDKPLIEVDAPGAAPIGVWAVVRTTRTMRTHQGSACADFAAVGQSGAVFVKVGPIAAGTQAIAVCNVRPHTFHDGVATVAELYLAAGGDLTPVSPKATATADLPEGIHWRTQEVRLKVSDASLVGQDLYAVLAARTTGAPARPAPAGLVRWDNALVFASIRANEPGDQ